jgi:hypothetical protein
MFSGLDDLQQSMCRANLAGGQKPLDFCAVLILRVDFKKRYVAFVALKRRRQKFS